MLRFLVVSVFCSSLLVQTALAESIEIKQEKSSVTITHKQKLCAATFEFIKPPTIKKQTIVLNENISMEFVQALSTQDLLGVELATNAICQKLIGYSYTGSNEEWSKFIDNAVSSLKKSGGKNMQLILAGDKGGYYSNKNDSDRFSHKEYTFMGTFKGTKQSIYNLAILDKQSNTVYTVSVSGAELIEKYIKNEFKRIVTAIKL